MLAVVFAAGFVTYRVLLATHRSSLSLILLILAGMPWSGLIGRGLRDMGPSLAVPVVLVGITLNALLFYLLGAGLERLAWNRHHHERV